MAYELWDVESRNIVGDYGTEEDALAVVRDLVRRDGPSAVRSLLLAFEDDRGRTTTIAAGPDLADRSRADARAPIPAATANG